MSELNGQEEFSCQTMGRQTAPPAKLLITEANGAIASVWDYFVNVICSTLEEIMVPLERPMVEPAHDSRTIIDGPGSHNTFYLLIPAGTSGALYVRLDQPGFQSCSAEKT